MHGPISSAYTQGFVVTLAQRTYAFICSMKIVAFFSFQNEKNSSSKKTNRKRRNLTAEKTRSRKVNVQGDPMKEETNRSTVATWCQRERERESDQGSRGQKTHTRTHTRTASKLDSINFQSIDHFHNDKTRTESTDISDVTAFAVIIDDSLYRAVILIVVKDIETLLVISGHPLMPVHVGQKVKIAIGMDSTQEFHLVVVQADAIAEILIAYIQCCEEKAMRSSLPLMSANQSYRVFDGSHGFVRLNGNSHGKIRFLASLRRESERRWQHVRVVKVKVRENFSSYV